MDVELAGPLGRQVAVALASGGAFALAVWWARLLTGPAALVAGALGASLVGLGGVAWAVPAMLFFGSAAGLSRLGRAQKRQLETPGANGPPPEPKGRNAKQVFANGGVAWALLLAAPALGEALCFWGFVGAFAAAAADTWATEVGALYGGVPRSLRTLRRVAAGTSGAVSPAGTLAAVGGAGGVALGAWPFAQGFVPPGGPAWVPTLLAAGAGLAGAFADSLAGAFLQARYRDLQTGQSVERPSAARRAHRQVGGLAALTNDGVNVICTAVGAAGAMAGVAVVF